jgi:hypothetical protein
MLRLLVGHDDPAVVGVVAQPVRHVVQAWHELAVHAHRRRLESQRIATVRERARLDPSGQEFVDRVLRQEAVPLTRLAERHFSSSRVANQADHITYGETRDLDDHLAPRRGLRRAQLIAPWTQQRAVLTMLVVHSLEFHLLLPFIKLFVRQQTRQSTA